ncbi:MFS transporter [Streptomyces sp. NPDC057636]|uniref:MFS transporter n=1 Tax=Streptomyces sp. NPDC057636 TaxID=3346189 RepID=UPI00369DE450
MLSAVFAFALLQSLINPVLPQLQKNLHTTPDLATWVITAFLLSASVFTPVLGRLGDRYGKDQILVVTLTALALGSLVSAVATNIAVMITGRVVQGVGGSVLPLAFGIIRDEMPREKIPGAIGLTSALAAAGGGVGLVLAGPLSDTLGIRALFWAPMILTAVAAVAARLVVPPSPSRDSGSTNWLSSVLMAGWLLALLVPLTQATKWGWASGKVIGLLIAAIALGVAWVVTESRSPSPLIDMRLMRIPAMWTTNVISLVFGMGLFSVFGFMPAFLQSPAQGGYGFGASATEAGLFLLPMTGTMFLAGLLSVRLALLVGARAVLVATAVLNTAALTMLAFLHDHPWQILTAMGLLGTAFGGAMATMSNVIVAAVRPDQTGVANGVNANVRTIGGALGSALMGGIIGAQLGSGQLPAEDGYTYGFAALSIAGLGAVLTALLVPKRGLNAQVKYASSGGAHP